MCTPKLPPPVPGVRVGDRVLVVGGYGARNAGDEAILAGLLASLPAICEVTVVSKDPARTQRMHRVRAVPPWQAARELTRADAVVIGGGGLFTSHVGPFARAIPAFGIAAKAAGCRVTLHGVSIDGTTPATTRVALTRLAHLCEGITVRDRQSVGMLESWGVQGARVERDLSLWAPSSPASQAKALLGIAGIDPERPLVGLALTAIEPACDAFLEKEVPALIAANPETQFCFIPMSRHPTVRRHNDLELADYLQRREPRLAILRAVEHPGDVIACFGALSAAVCMRYHSLLFASRAALPLVAVPYAAKCRAWCDENGIAPLGGHTGALIDAVGHALRRGEATG
jgi:polysaccharide pyruvyl transferase WcaK-like protein